MAGNNRLCLGRREQERKNGLRYLIACQLGLDEHLRLSRRHLHPAVLGKLDSCKKGGVQSPRAVVKFPMG